MSGRFPKSTLKASIEKEHLSLLGIESVAIHDAIKAGTEERDHYIDQYIQTIRNLAACDVHTVICYSFKPIFGWAKTNLFYQNEDGSFSLLYDQAVVDDMELVNVYVIHSQSKGFQLPGWEENDEKVPAFDGNL